ncbi:MAG: fibronectin type III domain-containing protein [bacterium]
MKRIIKIYLFTLSLSLFSIFILTVIPNTNIVNASFAGGDGTSTYPYRVSTCQDFQDIQNSGNAYYVVANDIDCSITETWNGGAGLVPIDLYSGANLDGRNKTISGIRINRPSESEIGIFGNVSHSNIKNLIITNANIEGGSSVGTLAGSLNVSNISGVSVSGGSVTGTYYIAGLVGSISIGTISKSSFSGNVTSTSAYGGGLVGYSTNAAISDCYIDATIIGANSSAGVAIGLESTSSTASITNTYVAGTMNDQNYNVGFTMDVTGDHVVIQNNLVVMKDLAETGASYFARTPTATTKNIANNYFDSFQFGYHTSTYWIVDTPGITEVAGVLEDGVTSTYPFKNTSGIAPFTSWDFSTIWEVNPTGYPKLRLPTLDALAPLSAPSNVTNLVNSSVGISSISIAWDEPTSNGGSTISNYKVEIKKSTDSDWTENLTANKNYTFNNLLSKTLYNIRVSAINATGTSGSEVIEVTTTAKPGAPTNLNVVKNAYNPLAVDITWVAPVDDGGRVIESYYVTVKNHSDTWENYIDSFSNWSIDPSASGYSNNFEYNTIYDFRVQAYNGNEYGDTSNTFEYTTPIEVVTHVKDCEDFQAIGQMGKYVLDNNIPCEGTTTWNQVPASDSYYGFTPIDYFEGTLDGQGYTVTGLYINNIDDNNMAIFRQLGSATVKNIKFSGANITGYNNVALIAGYADENNTLSFSNIDISNSTINGNYAIGGIIGALNYNNEVTFLNISLNIDIIGTTGIAGLVGYMDDYNIVEVHDSTFTGNIIGPNESDNIGGFFGSIYGDMSITNSSIHGNITGKQNVGGYIGYSDGYVDIYGSNSNAVVTGRVSLGGIIGNNSNEAYIRYSHFDGSVTAETDDPNSYPNMRVGGLVGYGNYTYVDNSYNTGDITGGFRVAGLVGSGSEVDINRSYNSGTIHASFDGDSGVDFKGVGGLTGMAWATYFTDSYNTGNISGEGGMYVGGLLGAGGENTNITRSFNSGSVYGDIHDHDYNGVGGITGSAIRAFFTDSYNEGDVVGSVRIGGIIGFAYQVALTNTYNTANVAGQNTIAAGGLVGSNTIIDNFFTSQSGVTISNSFNTGEVTSINDVLPDPSIDGGVIGYEGADESKIQTLTNNWWNNSKDNGIGKNDMVVDPDPQLPEIEGQYQKSESKDVFIGNNQNDPLNQWDYLDTWYVKDGVYPSFIYYEDRELPVITLLGDNPLYLTVSSSGQYTDPGATASDTFSGNLSSDIQIDDEEVNIAVAGTYHVTFIVFDQSGNKGEALRTVIVGSGPEILQSPSNLTYTSPNVYTKGTHITPLSPIVTGSVDSYSVTPNLPDGLTFSLGSGIISGTPTKVTSKATYTITATNTTGHTSFAIEITVNDAASVPASIIKKVSLIRTSSSSSSESSQDTVDVLLNDFNEYLDGTGKLLSDLTLGQVIHFNVGTSAHTATIKAVFDTYVIVTLASDNPKDIQLNLGETRKADVGDDGIMDIQMTLNSITDGKANIVFVELNNSSSSTISSTSSTRNTVTKLPNTSNTDILPIILLVVALLSFGGILIFILIRRKHRENE